MNRFALVLGVALFAAACAPQQYSSRHPYPELLAKLQASGGSLDALVVLRRAQQLTTLESGKRYKFALAADGVLRIAPLPFEAANNEYHHPIVGRGQRVVTAGGITVEHTNGATLTRVTIDQDSKSYQPSFQSLAAAEKYLRRVGVERTKITKRDQPGTTPGSQQMR